VANAFGGLNELAGVGALKFGPGLNEFAGVGVENGSNDEAPPKAEFEDGGARFTGAAAGIDILGVVACEVVLVVAEARRRLSPSCANSSICVALRAIAASMALASFLPASWCGSFLASFPPSKAASNPVPVGFVVEPPKGSLGAANGS